MTILKHNKSLQKTIFGLTCVTGLVGLSVCFDAKAKTDDSKVLEEIIVTARQREESIMEVPVAVSVMTKEEVKRYGAYDMRRMAQQMPQVEIQKGGAGSGATFIIRGIGSAAVDPGIEQTVLANLDNVLVSRGRIMDQAMFDIQQVQVLKGPQALFFGKNSPAGVISITSANPTDTMEGYITTGYETEAKEQFVEGAVSGPLSDTLMARLAARWSKMDGWVDNVAQPIPHPNDPTIMLPGRWADKLGADEGFSTRLTLLYKPSEFFESNLKIMRGQRKENSDNHFEPICAPGVEHPTVLGRVDLQSDCSLNNRIASAAKLPSQVLYSSNPSGIPFSDQVNTVISWQNNFDLNNMSLTLISGYLTLDKKGRGDSSTSSFGLPGGGSDEKTKNYSQEIRLISNFDGDWNFTLGGYYEHVDREQYAELHLAFLPTDPATGRRMSSIKAADVTGKTYSMLGQLRWNIRPDLEAAAGLRWTREEKDTSQSNPYVHPAFAAAFWGPDTIIRSDYEDDDTSPEVTLTWKPTEDTTLYAAYKTGYKSGGIADPLILTKADTATSVIFRNEDVEGGEVGYKARFLDRAMAVDLTAYRYTYDGLQTSSFDNQLLRYLLRNAASARTTGVEGNLNWQMTDQFNLHAAFGYNKAEFTDFKGGPCYAGQTAAQGCINGQQDNTGKDMYRAPKLSFTLGGNYDVPITDRLAINFTADTRYTDDYIAGDNYNPLTEQDSFWLVNASIRLYSETDGWELAFVGRNLSDENYIGFAVDHPGGSPGQVAVRGTRGQEYWLQASYRF